MAHRFGHFARAALTAAIIATGVLHAGRQAPLATRDAQAATAALPARLTDSAFWQLATDVSEPGGFFRITDNFTSNESEVAQVFTLLRERGTKGGVYLGVGPEQNFSYIAAVRPAMAFVIDIRRQAAMQHLMFKAMFELAKDRADFLSLLFARPRPEGMDASTPVQALWQAYFGVALDQALAASTRSRVVDRLTKTHRFEITADEMAQLDGVMMAFVQFGPGITTRGSQGGRGGGNNVSFADLTGWMADRAGQVQSFLSTEEHFLAVKSLHDKNLIVPVTGDFGGPKTLRAIGAYLRERGATVSAFYVSNVEQYLFMDGKQGIFYDNVAALPLSATSVFVRPYALRRFDGTPLCAIPGFLKTHHAGKVLSHNDALACAP